MTHLKYADDTLIFCGSEEDQLQYLRVILVLFEGILGLHMTWRKSFQYHIPDVANMEALNIMLVARWNPFLPHTWGMPFRDKCKSLVFWNTVIAKCEKNWPDGKNSTCLLEVVTQINSVVDSIPTYMMSQFPTLAGLSTDWTESEGKVPMEGYKRMKIVLSRKSYGREIKKENGII